MHITNKMKREQSIFARSFSQNEVKRLGCGAIFVFITMEFTLFSVFNVPILNLQQSMSSSLKILMNFQKMGEQIQIYTRAETFDSFYNLTNSRSQVYEINGDVRITNISSTITIASSDLRIGNMTSSWITRPYPRAHDNTKFEPIREWTIRIPSLEEIPKCNRTYNTPAILFSTGAFSPNYFHSFTDLLIPLYLTSLEFNGEVIFLITGYRTLWNAKYQKVLEQLTNYDIVDIDNENEVLCYSKMIVGLKANREFGLDPSVPPYYSMKEFRKFLRKAYSLDRELVNECYKNCGTRKPRLVIVSRKKSRRILNEDDIVKLAQKVGFEVVIREMGWNVSTVSKSVNTFDVMLGVHGAGMTNMVFLPDNAVVIQIVPFGLELVSSTFFEFPAKGMNFKYLEYKVDLNESSLLGKYPSDSLVYRDPQAVHRKGWMTFRKIYFDCEGVKLDLVRFEKTLLDAKALVTN